MCNIQNYYTCQCGTTCPWTEPSIRRVSSSRVWLVVYKKPNPWAEHLVADLALEVAGGWWTRFAQISFGLQLLNVSYFELFYSWLACEMPTSSVHCECFQFRGCDATLSHCGITPSELETLAMDRAGWHFICKSAVEEFEVRRIQQLRVPDLPPDVSFTDWPSCPQQVTLVMMRLVVSMAHSMISILDVLNNFMKNLFTVKLC